MRVAVTLGGFYTRETQWFSNFGSPEKLDRVKSSEISMSKPARGGSDDSGRITGGVKWPAPPRSLRSTRTDPRKIVLPERPVREWIKMRREVCRLAESWSHRGRGHGTDGGERAGVSLTPRTTRRKRGMGMVLRQFDCARRHGNFTQVSLKAFPSKLPAGGDGLARARQVG